MGEGKLTADERDHGVSDGLEEEVSVQHVDLDQHDHTSSDDVEEGDDVECADDVQNDISWTSQGLSELCHHDCWNSMSKSADRRSYGDPRKYEMWWERLVAVPAIIKDGKEATGQQEALPPNKEEESVKENEVNSRQNKGQRTRSE